MSTDFPYSLGDAFRELEENTSQDRSAQQLLSNIRTVLRRYQLPYLVENPEQYEGFKNDKLMLVLNYISLHDYVMAEPEKVFQTAISQAIEEGLITTDTARTTYLPAFKALIKFIRNHAGYAVVVTDTSSPYAPKVKPSISKATTRKGKRSCWENSYGVLMEQFLLATQNEFQHLKVFCTDKEVVERCDPKPLRLRTYETNVERSLLLFFGYLHNVKGFALKDLSMKLVLLDGLDSKEQGFRLFKEFVSWGVSIRGNSYGWAMSVTKGLLNVAKWTYAHQSKQTSYRDIPLVAEVRGYMFELAGRYKQQKKGKHAERAEKEMTMEQCIEVVNFLRACCAPRRANHAKRSDMAVMRSYLRYLLVAIFTYCPLRQREVRELELGRTLFREDGYRVVLQPEDNKTGVHREFRLADMLPSQVIKDLDYWIDHWRPWFLDQVRKDAATRAAWLATLGYSEAQLTQEIQSLQDQIKSRRAASEDEAGTKSLMKKLRKLRKIDASWNCAQDALAKQYVFFLLGGTTGRESRGQPYMRENMRDIVVTAVYDATSKLIENEHPLFKGLSPKYTNPHFFRNIATTHQRRNGDPSEREAFHQVIGNSVHEGDRTYNEMTPEERTARAKEWWKPKKQQQSDAELHTFLSSMTPEQRKKLKKLLG